MFPKKYALGITDQTAELIQFLNDGVRPDVKTGENRSTSFLFTIDSPREITVERDAIQFEDDLWNVKGFLKDSDLTMIE